MTNFDLPAPASASSGIQGSGLQTSIQFQIWNEKYRYGDEPHIAATWRRVASAIAEAEAPENRECWAEVFFNAMTDFKFIPAGRILSGAGTGRKVTLFNCFVMGTVHDSMDGIFQALRESALTMQQGGGIGIDFSTLRPKGALVRGVGADASGPLSFMDVWDAMCKTIMSAGSRRGAMMGTLRCDHPDIEAFIEAKADPVRLRNFNLSVLITDAFMEAVKAGRKWPLVFNEKAHKLVEARDLFDKITRSAYEFAEPGVIFIDRVNKLNPLSHCETISCSNPCGEQMLPPYGACLLGSINLAAFIRAPFTDTAQIHFPDLLETVKVAIRFLDNVIDVSGYPLPEQEAEAKAKRRIGLGITGLADALAMVGLHYSGLSGAAKAGDWMRTIAGYAANASYRLAKEKGAFPLYDAQVYDSGRANYRRWDSYIPNFAPAIGLRNSHLLSIAPTGTISLLAGNVSSGIEPIFSYHYNRTILNPDGSKRVERVEDYAWHRFMTDNPGKNLPDSFVTARELAPAGHLAMQAGLQPYVDASISKTINCPADIAFKDFRGIYERAYDSGLKGCTLYRPNAITGAVLEAGTPEGATTESAVAEPADESQEPYFVVTPAGREAAGLALRARDPVLHGSTYKLRWPQSEHAIYITINDVIDGATRRPYEVFINSKNLEHYAWTVALTRMVSAIFRRGGDIRFVADELRAVFDPRGGAYMDGGYVPSLLAAIGNVIQKHCQIVSCNSGGSSSLLAAVDETIELTAGATAPANDPAPVPRALCPKCYSTDLVMQEGCKSCRNCGWSKCS